MSFIRPTSPVARHSPSRASLSPLLSPVAEEPSTSSSSSRKFRQPLHFHSPPLPIHTPPSLLKRSNSSSSESSSTSSTPASPAYYSHSAPNSRPSSPTLGRGHDWLATPRSSQPTKLSLPAPIAISAPTTSSPLKPVRPRLQRRDTPRPATAYAVDAE